MQGQDQKQNTNRPGSETASQDRKSPAKLSSNKKRGIRYIFSYQLWKAALDRLLALIALIILFPFLAIITLIIRLDSPGNPILCQERVGKEGRTFTLYKFRSMHINHDDSKYQEFIRNYVAGNATNRLGQNGEDIYELIKDPRVTRFGAILRKTNIDELPQFFNVLKGDMSLVGPRPDIHFAVAMYQDHHWDRFKVTPGITGLWQVTGRKRVPFEEQIRLDLDYIDKQSLLLDAKIILLTVGTILRGDGS